MNDQPLKYFDSLYPETSRQKEMQQFIPFIEKGLSAQIIGLPGVGKSNILRLLAYNKDVRLKNYGEYEKLLHFVYIDSSEVKDKSLFDITKFILISLVFSLGERRMADESKHINELLKEGVAMQDEMLLFQSLKQALDYLSIERKMSVHLLFDKFDTMLPNLPSQFFTDLRILRNHAKYRFGAFFSLTRPIQELIDTTLLTDFHDLIAENEVYVSLYDPEGMNFRLDYIEKAARHSLSKDMHEELIKLTGGHAKLTKLAFESLVTENREIKNVKEYLLNRSTIQGGLWEIWNALTPSEQIALKRGIGYKEAESGYPYLINSELINEKGLSIALFEDFIKTIPVDSKEKITYDPTLNEILVGQQGISDLLSPSEFRLLRYLIDNKERLCTKDEIISAVWKDTKTQEGVTDQALDQIFYRLRKKIEHDPSNPHFIQTIKGKGYKLTD